MKKGSVETQIPNAFIIKRNGAIVEDDVLTIRVACILPLINDTFINGKAIFALVKSILNTIEEQIDLFDLEQYRLHEEIYMKQQEIRTFVKKNGYIAFIANGSVLPRENGTSEPMKDAIPFKIPESMEITVPFADGTTLLGMGIPEGITVITGGGYSGKSTLLDALEMGIYNHVLGDGREFVITEDTALKIYAEDGRPVYDVDLSPFFRYLPNNADVTSFSTLGASGSVSQAAGIIEALCGGSKLLLIDEDKSATNFMIRDIYMRKIVKHEPIIPLTDRIREIYIEKGGSTVLVIGGSSEYLNYADTTLLMDDYIVENITNEVKEIFNKPKEEGGRGEWMEGRYLVPRQTNQPFLYFNYVKNENNKKIILDSYSADITLLTALHSEYQLSTLAYMMERILTDLEVDRAPLIDIVHELIQSMYNPKIEHVGSLFNPKSQQWIEAVRPLDLFCCANRMRGLRFTTQVEIR